MIFSCFAVPRQYQHRVLVDGVLGALVFGAFLILTGIRMLVLRNKHIDPSKSKNLRLFRRVVPTSDEYDGQEFLTRRNGMLVVKIPTALSLGIVIVIMATSLAASLWASRHRHPDASHEERTPHA